MFGRLHFILLELGTSEYHGKVIHAIPELPDMYGMVTIVLISFGVGATAMPRLGSEHRRGFLQLHKIIY